MHFQIKERKAAKYDRIILFANLNAIFIKYAVIKNEKIRAEKIKYIKIIKYSIKINKARKLCGCKHISNFLTISDASLNIGCVLQKY